MAFLLFGFFFVGVMIIFFVGGDDNIDNIFFVCFLFYLVLLFNPF